MCFLFKAKLSDALMHDAVDDHDKGSASLPAPIVGAMKRKSRGKASEGDDSERGAHDDSIEDEEEEEYVEGETNVGSRVRVSNGSAGDAAADVMTQSVPVGRLLLMVRPVAHVSCCTRTTGGSTAAGDYTCLATLHACICCSASATSNLQTEASADVEVV